MKIHIVLYADLQEFLDNHGDKIKFITVYDSTRMTVIVEED